MIKFDTRLLYFTICGPTQKRRD